MMSFLKDFWAFLSTRKKYWLLPILLMMLAAWGAAGVRARKRDRSIYLYALLTTARRCEF